MKGWELNLRANTCIDYWAGCLKRCCWRQACHLFNWVLQVRVARIHLWLVLGRLHSVLLISIKLLHSSLPYVKWCYLLVNLSFWGSCNWFTYTTTTTTTLFHYNQTVITTSDIAWGLSCLSVSWFPKSTLWEVDILSLVLLLLIVVIQWISLSYTLVICLDHQFLSGILFIRMLSLYRHWWKCWTNYSKRACTVLSYSFYLRMVSWGFLLTYVSKNAGLLNLFSKLCLYMMLTFRWCTLSPSKSWWVFRCYPFYLLKFRAISYYCCMIRHHFLWLSMLFL